MLARRHFGYATTAELREAGLSDDAIFTARGPAACTADAAACTRSAIRALSRSPSLPPPFSPAARVPRSATGRRPPSGRLRRAWPDLPEVTVPRDRRIPGVTVHRSQTLAARDVRTHLGIRTTSAARTVLDLAPG